MKQRWPMAAGTAARPGLAHITLPDSTAPSSSIRKGSRSKLLSAKRCRILAERKTRCGFELGDRLRPAFHLDRCHSHHTRWLEIDSEIIEIDAGARFDLQALAHHPVDARIWFANTDLGRLDHRVELFHDLTRIEAACPGGRRAVCGARRHIVGDAPGFQTVSLDPVQCGNHFRPEVACEKSDHVAPRHVVAESLCFRGESRVERGNIEFCPLEPRPGIVLMIGRGSSGQNSILPARTAPRHCPHDWWN